MPESLLPKNLQDLAGVLDSLVRVSRWVEKTVDQPTTFV